MQFGASTGFKTNKHNAMNSIKGEGSTNKITLDKICPRAKNKYTINQNDFVSIKKSIKEQGLFEPIILNRISAYLESKGNEHIDSEDRKYYEEQLKEGREYFITSGNTRFFCYCSNCVNKDIRKKEDMPEFYKLYEIASDKQALLRAEGKTEGLNEFLAIDVSVVEDDYYHERDRYNSANIDQRTVASYDFIINIIDEMKDNNIYQNKEKEIQNELISDMFSDPSTAPRKANAYFERIEKDKIFMDSISADDVKKIKKGYTNLEETRKFIERLPAKTLYGFDKEINQTILEYIQETREKKESLTNIKKARDVFGTYPKEVEELIFNGDISFNVALNFMPIYRELVKEKREEATQMMVSEKLGFNINTATETLTGKSNKRDKKTTNKKPIGLSQNEWADLIKDIKYGKKTIDEVWEYLQKLNIV